MTEVVIENLTAAASKLSGIASALDGYDFKETNADGKSFGHVELAEWFVATCEHNDETGTSLGQTSGRLGSQLSRAAELYRDTDQASADAQLLEEWGYGGETR